ADPQNSHVRPTFSALNTEIAWQLWHLTAVFWACNPRAESGMARNATTRSCSTMTVAAPRCSSVAGDSVPQNGQIRRCLAGFQCASAPHAGQWYSSRAVATSSSPRSVRVVRSPCSLTPRLFQEIGQRRAGDAPLRANALALEIARFERRDHIGFRHAER